MSGDLRALVTNIQGFSTEDGPGIRTTVFFKGCPLSCPWCHNPEGMSAKEELIFHPDKCIGCKECVKVCKHGAPVPGGKGFEACESCFKCADACPPAARKKMGEWWTVKDLAAKVLRDRVYYETSGGGVTASGGEAMIWPEFIREFFKTLKAENIHTALDTSGVVGGEPLARALEFTDLALVDLKILDEKKHREIIGVELPPILDHIREIDRSGVAMVFRLPIVPVYTDPDENIDAIARFVKTLSRGVTVELLPYHRMGEAKYHHLGRPYSLSEIKPPSSERMREIKDAFAKAGVRAVIGGEDDR